ncbi:MAG TPA: tetratricopeptide repeat protein [Opitutaceae bacterium]|nr:tetratricopeptide repeat protein [Opitutaceae bacterium]
MAATPPSDSKSSGSPEGNAIPVSLEERLAQFWQKNRAIVLGLCALVLLVILGKGIWERYTAGQENDVEAAYQSAVTPDELRAFVAAHPTHSLAAVAEIRLADEAYQKGNAADALAGYEKAQTILKSGPLATRARLGHALAEVQAGNQSQGVSELMQIFNDPTQFKVARAEAGYQLCSLAAQANNTADVQKYGEQLMQIDPQSPWAQRAMMLRATMPAPAAPAAAAATAPANTSSGPSLKVNIPGK